MNSVEVQGTNRVPYKKSKEYWRQYNQKRLAYIVAKNRERRIFLKANQSPKPLSEFQQNKQKHLLKLLVNNRSFVPVPTKLKHPIIKNWNASNYWYNKKIDLNNLERGCVRIYEDNWKNCYIGWLDIDCKKWTKIAKKYACGYVKSPKGHIRIPFLFKNKNQEKTGTFYYQNQKIGDAKISGEVMLPGNTYYDKEGKKLGYYEWKHWGTFFPKRNYIFKNPTEFWELLKEDFNIEYKSIREHLVYQKIHTEIDYNTIQEVLNVPVKEPPWQKMIITPRNSFQNRY